MAVQIINTLFDGTSHYEQSTILDGSSYLLSFDYNVRDEHWYFSLRTVDEEPISGFTGLKLVQNWFPGRLSRDINKPPGLFLVSSEQHTEPGLLDLGDGTTLFYIPEADIEALET